MIQTWPQENEVQRLVFVSDLHLFTSRSRDHRQQIRRCIDKADLCVWGGDLFDFRWSRLPSETQSIERSLQWLQHWYDEFPAKHFVYLDGNHDAHESFQSRLNQWSASRDRFWSGLDCLRVGNTLLLHGDVIEGDGTADSFAHYRGSWRAKPVASRSANRAYDIVVAARMHRATAMAAHRRRRTCLRLIRWLHRQPDEQTQGIERIVFGHTHRRIRGYRFSNFEFYNGGAAVRHVPFEPVMLDFPSTP